MIQRVELVRWGGGLPLGIIPAEAMLKFSMNGTVLRSMFLQQERHLTSDEAVSMCRDTWYQRPFSGPLV
jgi:hypothetical protein